MGQKHRKVLNREKILLHLLGHTSYVSDLIVPKEVTQAGMCTALSISQAQVSKELKRLRSMELVEERLAHVLGSPKMLRAYFLTKKGREEAEKLLSHRPWKKVSPEKILDYISGTLEALRYIEKTALREEEELKILLKLQEVYLTLGNWTEENEAYYRAIELSKKQKNDLALIKTYYNYAKALRRTGNYKTAIVELNKALEIAENYGDYRILTEIHLSLGSAYLKMRKNRLQRVQLERALECAERTGDENLLFRVYIDLSILYMHLGDKERTEEYLERAKELSEGVKKNAHLLRFYNNMGIYHIIVDEFSEAILWFKKLIEEAKAKNNLLGQSYALVNIGYAYAKLNEVEKAASANEKATPLFRFLGEPELLGGLWRNKAMVHMLRGEWEKTQECFWNSIKTLEEVEDPIALGITYLEFGKAYGERGVFKLAKRYIEQALELFETGESIPFIQKAKSALLSLRG